MKLSKVISQLQNTLEVNGDIEVTYNIFTIFDIMAMEETDEDGNCIYPVKDEELATEIIHGCEKYMWDSVSDYLWDSIWVNVKHVLKRRNQEKKDYQKYLELKAKFENTEG